MKDKNIINKIKLLAEKGAFHIMVGTFATKFVTFFGVVFLARILTKNDLGVLSYMENICSYAYLFMGLGMANAVLRYSIKKDTVDEQYSVYMYAVKKSLVIDAVIVVVIIAINHFYPHTEGFSAAKYLIPILILALPFQDLINMALINERALFCNKRFAVLSLTSAALIVAARITGAIKYELKGTVVGIVAINVIIATVYVYLERRDHFRDAKEVRLPDSLKKEMSVYAFQYMVTNGLWGAFMLTDLYLIGRLIQIPETVADFKIAYSFPANMSIFSGAIGIFVASYFIKNEDNTKWVSDKYKITLKASALLMAMVSVAMIVLARPLIWLYGSQYYNVIPLMRLLVIGMFIENAFRQPTANILAAIGKVKYNMVISVMGLLLQIVLDIVLIPVMGVYAVPIATVVVRSAMSIALIASVNKIYNIMGDHSKEDLNGDEKNIQ